MYTKELRPKYFSAIPIYDLINNKSFSLTEREKKRIEEILLMSTKYLIGKRFGIDKIKKEYFFINNSYYEFNEEEKNFCNILKSYEESKIYKYINEANSMTFIGDSITEGTKNGYHPWFEPMIRCFSNKKIINISKGSYTTKLILDKFNNEIINSRSDLYIIALGTNDVRYRNSLICSMNPKEYVKNMDKIVDLIKNPQAKIIFIAPWFSTKDDSKTKLNHIDKIRLMKKYSLELKSYTKLKNYIFIDPNDYIEKKVIKNKKKYLIDFTHPNDKEGIELYCEAVFMD